jgi:hypothetical protein
MHTTLTQTVTYDFGTKDIVVEVYVENGDGTFTMVFPTPPTSPGSGVGVDSITVAADGNSLSITFKDPGGGKTVNYRVVILD